MTRKYIKVNDKFTVGPKKKPYEELSYHSQYIRKKYEENPVEHEKYLASQKEFYRKNKPKLQKQKAELNKKRLLKAIKLLGGKCVSCGEPLNLNLKKANLQLHHLYYDKNDLIKKTRFGKSYGTVPDVLTMAEKGINPKKKYALLCIQCHEIETFSHQDPKKTFDMFAWMYEQGMFDEILNDDDVNNKKITEFLKQS